MYKYIFNKKMPNKTKELDIVTHMLESINNNFSLDIDETLSVEEQYEYIKNKFAQLCEIDTKVKEHRSNFINKLDTLHQQFMKTDVEDTKPGNREIFDNDSEPDVDVELETQEDVKDTSQVSEKEPITKSKTKKKVTKKVTKNESSNKNKDKDTIEENTELTEHEPEQGSVQSLARDSIQEPDSEPEPEPEPVKSDKKTKITKPQNKKKRGKKKKTDE